MKLINIVETLIIENYQLDKLKEKYVVNDKKVSEEDFNQILDVSRNKFAFVSWLTIKVAEGIIWPEDIYKFKHYFDVFEKNKSQYDIKDITKYKTKEDVENFKLHTIKIIEKLASRGKSIDEKDKDKYVSSNDIDKLESVGIKFLGMSDGYQVFEVPSTLKGNENAFKTYKAILARCQGREIGKIISICTMGSMFHFNKYFNDHPGSSYFVMFNLNDELSPWQLHFESGQFKDRTDTEYGI